MSLDEGIKALISYRLESAREKLSAAEDLLEKRHYKDSVSRSYSPSRPPNVENTPCNPVEPYALSKYNAELRAIEIARESEMALTILRLATLYGEGDILSLCGFRRRRLCF